MGDMLLAPTTRLFRKLLAAGRHFAGSVSHAHRKGGAIPRLDVMGSGFLGLRAVRYCAFGATLSACTPGSGGGRDGVNGASPSAAKSMGRAEANPQPVDWPDELLAEQYRAARDRLAPPAPELGANAAVLPSRQLDDAEFAELRTVLRRVIEHADDAHLRANASLLLGSVYASRRDDARAISYYRQAAATVPEEAEPHAVLALALAAKGEFVEAVGVQETVVRLVPDDLQAWLLLGEYNMKVGRTDDAQMAYAAYETRRKGLLDGLTLRDKAGEYLTSERDRVLCAFNLAAAKDEGTALGLLYALRSETSPAVLAELARLMGSQRFRGYEKGLRERLAKLKVEEGQGVEGRAELVSVFEWALAEIARDPIDLPQSAAPTEADIVTTPPAAPGAQKTRP